MTQAQVKIDQTTPLTWAVYQAGKGDKLDKKLSNLVLALVGHRYLLIDLKAKRVYEVPVKQVHLQGDGCETDELAESSHSDTHLGLDLEKRRAGRALPFHAG